VNVNLSLVGFLTCAADRWILKGQMSSIESVGRMTPTPFFVVTAALEIGAGLVFLVAPALVIRMLFAASDIQTGVAIGRVAGAALLSLGAACWWARHDGGSAASSGLVSGLLIYNVAVVALILTGSLGSRSPLLWAAIAVHGAMALWCVLVVTARPASVGA
jgi:hypothetical protein